MTTPFYPVPAPVPEELCTPAWIARPLGPVDAVIDHAAYIASPDTIRIHSRGRWPTEGFTVEENVRLAAQHEQYHRERTNFAFLLRTLDGSASLGCFYLLPLLPFLHRMQAPANLIACPGPHDALLTFWIRQDLDQTPFARDLVAALVPWLQTAWRFNRTLFRVTDQEHGSIRALEGNGLRRLFSLAVPDTADTYLLYGHDKALSRAAFTNGSSPRLAS